MGSHLPFPQLNSSGASSSSSSLPKTPKLEPIDEPSNPNFSSSSNPNLLRSSESNLMLPHSTTITKNQPENVVILHSESNPCQPRHRPGDLVRAADHLSPEDEVYFREMFRKTRMTYNSFRVFGRFMESKREARIRADLVAGQTMSERAMWLNHDKRVVGSIPGIKVGDIFLYRKELCVVGLHGQHQVGIDYIPISQSPSGEPIATSIVVSGESEDDLDCGDVIVYIGQGEDDKDQMLEGGNLALERSMHYGIEVRVVRGLKYEGSVSGEVYVYDGLYRVLGFRFDVGRSGFGVYKFKLARIKNQQEMGSVVLKYAASLPDKILSEWPKGYITLDISKGKENVPIMVFNDVDDNKEPLNYDYITTAVFPWNVYSGENRIGCVCVNDCNENCRCASKNGGDFAYERNGLLVRGKPLVFECGGNCGCPPSCRNRVSQNGIKNRLEIFRSKETGWGVRSRDLIQAGSFICEFAGVVLSQTQAVIASLGGVNLVYPTRFPERWAEWGDLSQIFTDYVRPTKPSIPQLNFAMDTAAKRNIGCYIGHSSSPNAFLQYVLYDHNYLIFPHLMLFAMENISPLREITLDRGVSDQGSGNPQIFHN